MTLFRVRKEATVLAKTVGITMTLELNSFGEDILRERIFILNVKQNW